MREEKGEQMGGGHGEQEGVRQKRKGGVSGGAAGNRRQELPKKSRPGKQLRALREVAAEKC